MSATGNSIEAYGHAFRTLYQRVKPVIAERHAVAAILTALLHLLIAYGLLHVTTSAVRPLRPPLAAHPTNVHKLYDAGEQIISVDIRPGLSRSGWVCKSSSYVGIGITADPRTQRIILVGEDTPASRAGLQRDDIVLNPDVWGNARQEGALLHVLILRGNVQLTLSVRVGMVCIE